METASTYKNTLPLGLVKDLFNLFVNKYLNPKDRAALARICKYALARIQNQPSWRVEIEQRWGQVVDWKGTWLNLYANLRRSEHELFTGKFKEQIINADDRALGAYSFFEKQNAPRTLSHKLTHSTQGSGVLTVVNRLSANGAKIDGYIALTRLAGECSNFLLKVGPNVKMVKAYLSQTATHIIFLKGDELQVYSSQMRDKWEEPHQLKFVDSLCEDMVVHGDDMWVCAVTQTSFAYRNHHLEGKLIEIKTTDTSDFSRLSTLASGKSVIVAFSREHKVYCLTLGQEEQEALNPVTEMTKAVTSLCLFSHNNRCSLAINTADNIISLWDFQLQNTTSTLNHEGRAGFVRHIPYWGVTLFNSFGESFQWDLENSQLIEINGPPTPIEGISPPKYLDELFEFTPNAHARAALVIQEGFLHLVMLNEHQATIFTPHCAPLDSNVPSWIDIIINWFWGTIWA